MFHGLAGGTSELLNFCLVWLLRILELIFGLCYHAGSGIERVEYKQSYLGSENAFPAGRQNWNMEFKDAASAAQAAAESAELASMAARAAAELSRQYSSESRKSYGHVPKDERPHLYADSKLQSHHVAEDAENDVFHGRHSGIRGERTVDKEEEELAGPAGRFVGDGHRNNDRFNKASSLKSNKTSVDDVRLVNNIQAVDRHSRRKSSDSDNVDFLDEASKKKQSSESDLKYVAKKLDCVKSEETAYIDEKVTRKQSSGISRHSHSSSFSDDQEDILRKNDDVAYYEDMRTEKQSSRASSRSHSSSSGDVHGDIFKRNDFSQDPFVHDDRSIYRNTSEINSNEYTAVFDDYGSDDGNNKLEMGNYKEQETILNFSSPRRNTDKGLGKSISQSHQSVFSEIPEGSSFPAQSDDMPPAAFDYYDSPTSDNEEDFHKSKLAGSTELHKFPSEKNVHSKSSEPVQSEEHISAGSSFSEDRNVGPKRNPWLPTSSVDLQPNEVLRDRRSQGIKSSHTSEKKFDYAVKDTLESATKDTELPNESTSEIAKELNFRTLTGGLRNKGNRRPPYMRKPSENFLSVKQATEDTNTENDQSTSSSTVRSSIRSTGYQEPHSEKSNATLDKKVSVAAFAKHVDSDDDHVEKEHQQETSISKQQLYNQKSGSEVHKKSSLRASRTYFDSDLDNSDSDEDHPRLTSSRNARPGAGLSRRTKVSSSNSGRTNSKTTVSSLESRTANYRAENKSPSSSSTVKETLPKPLSETKSSDNSGSWERHRLVEQDSSKPMPKSRRSSRIESSKPSTREQTSNSLPKNATSGVTGASNSPVVTRETSLTDSTGHVHPKLPDSDAFTAYFQSLRQTRE